MKHSYTLFQRAPTIYANTPLSSGYIPRSETNIIQEISDLSKTPTEKLDSLVEKSQRILYTANTVFPFDLFPDTVSIDENKISVVKRTFFFTQSISTILIKNILGISVNSSPFFASITIEIVGFEQNPDIVKFLWKKDATKMRQLIMGLIACAKEGVDTSTIPNEELVRKIEEIGKNTAV